MRGEDFNLSTIVPSYAQKAIHHAIGENDKLFEETANTLRKCILEIHNLFGSTETYYIKHADDLGLANDNPLLLGYEKLLEVDRILDKTENIFLRTDHSLSLHHRMLKRLERQLVEEHADREILHKYLTQYIECLRVSREHVELVGSIKHVLVRIRERFLRFQAFSDWTNTDMHEMPETIEDAQNLHSFNHRRKKELEELHSFLKGMLYDNTYTADSFNHLCEFVPYHFTLKEERALGNLQDEFNEKVIEMFTQYERFLEHHKHIRRFKPKHRVGLDEDFEVDKKLRFHYMKKDFIHSVMLLVKTHIHGNEFLNKKTFLRHLDILTRDYQYDLRWTLRIGQTALQHLGEIHTKLLNFNDNVLKDTYGSYRCAVERLRIMSHIHLHELSIFSLGSLQGLVRRSLESFEDMREQELEIFEEILEAERVIEHLYTEKHKNVLHDTFLETFLYKVAH